MLAVPRPSQLERILPIVSSLGVTTLVLCQARKVRKRMQRSITLLQTFAWFSRCSRSQSAAVLHILRRAVGSKSLSVSLFLCCCAVSSVRGDRPRVVPGSEGEKERLLQSIMLYRVLNSAVGAVGHRALL